MNADIQHFMDWLVGVQTQKHLQGQHNQRTHGRRMGMRALSNHLYDLIMKEGGFTYRPRKGTRKKGIVVAIPGHEEGVPKKSLHKKDVYDYVRRVMSTIKADKRNHIGAFVSDEGVVVFDVSRIFTDEREARKQGTKWKQQSLWDLGESKLIVLNADEGRVAALAAAGGE